MKPNSQYDCIVVGSFNFDISYYVNSFPQPGEVTIGSIGTCCGGKGYNQAIGTNRLGLKTCFYGAVGNDVYAPMAKLKLKEEGLDSSLLIMEDCSTGLAVIGIDASGQNIIFLNLGANEKIDPKSIPLDKITESKVLLTQLEINPEVILESLKFARKKKVKTILNAAPNLNYLTLEILELTDIAIFNESEFKQMLVKFFDKNVENLIKLSNAEIHDFCKKLKIESVIVTLGARGSLVSVKNKYEFIPAYKHLKVIDTVGAGDAFVAGLVAGFLRFENIFEAAKYASSVAALNITKKGASSAMPTSREVDLFIKELQEMKQNESSVELHELNKS